MKKFLSTSACLILVTIQKVRSFFGQANKKLIDKMKDVPEETCLIYYTTILYYSQCYIISSYTILCNTMLS